MTILLAVGLIPLVSTTVKAADITDEYTYKQYVTDKSGHYHIFLSDTEFESRKGVSQVTDFNTGTVENLNTGWYYVTTWNTTGTVLHLAYIGSTWECIIPVRQYTDTARFYFMAENDIVTSSTSKPSGFPAITAGISKDDVTDMINNALNATTSVTTSAKSIQTQATNAYVDYSNGSITLAQLQSTIDSLASQLQALNNNSSATLADKVAVNNAITQTQLVQDAANKDAIIQEMEEDLTVSSSVSSTITGKINQANQIFTEYSQGTTTQTEAVTQINQYITQLTQLITPQTPTADINAINSAINTINGIKDSVTSHSELSPEVSEEQVKSDQEEIEMLNEMVSVMQDQVIEDKMEDQQIAGKADAINNILNPVWENKFFTYLIGTSSVLIIACILLHVRFRML